MIKVEGLSKSFNGLMALNNVSFSVDSGEIFAFIGPNGSGKTTTVRTLLGLLKPDSGVADVIDVKHTHNWRRSVGFVLEDEKPFFLLTPREYLRFFGQVYGVENLETKISEMLSTLRIDDNGTKTISQYSKGNQRKLCLAKALIHEPSILLLDEPLDGIEPETRRDIKDMLASLGNNNCTILITSHNLDEMENICTTVGLINAGVFKGKTGMKAITSRGMTLESFYIQGDKKIMKKISLLYRREVDEVYLKRKGGLLWQAFMALVIIPTAAQPLLRQQAITSQIGGTRMIMYITIPSFIILSLGLPFLMEHFYKDRIKKNFEVLFSCGYTPIEVWAAKILATASAILLLYVVGLITAIFLALVVLKSDVAFGPMNILLLFIMPTFLSLSLLGLKGTLHFVFNDMRLMTIFFMLPFVLTFVIFSYASSLFNISVINISAWGVMLFEFIISFILLLISIIILKLTPVESYLIS